MGLCGKSLTFRDGRTNFLISGFGNLVSAGAFRPLSTAGQKPETNIRQDLSRWKRFRYWLEEIGCRFLAWWLPHLSRRRCVKLGLLVGDLAYFLDLRGRAVALANLECALGDSYTAEHRRWIARLSYRNFAGTMLDIFWARRLEPANYRHLVRDEGFAEVCAQARREKRGLVFIMTHQGNWELSSVASAFWGIENTVVTENFKNPRLEAIFRDLRSSSGQVVIPQENSMLRMLKVVKRGGATGMLIDLSLRPSQGATIVESFGMKMCVPVIHAVLAQRAGALIVPVETVPSSDGTCQVKAYPGLVIDPNATLQQIAQQCWDALEPMVRRRPDLWLWPYKYFRYRPKGTPREYPFYARESSPFEKLQRSLEKDHD
jgi:lauroyl/myristoyl acyltransferase